MEDETLRLHTDTHGVVWCGQNGIMAVNTEFGPEEFVGMKVFKEARRVRLIGTPANARLIIRAYESAQRSLGKIEKKIMIGSPMLCYRPELLMHPEFVLQQMRQPDVAASANGCWHRMLSHDYNNYLLIQALQDNHGEVNDLVKSVARHHPVWQAVSFIPEKNLTAAIKLACEIVDPRWYNDPMRPGRMQRLLTYLGIHPRNMRAMLTLISPADTPGCRNWRRAELVVEAWGGLKTPTPDLDNPRNFLWRIRQSYDDEAKGLLKASKVFIQYLRLVWLQELAHGSRQVFCPEYFFKQPAEVDAYLKYRSTVS